MTHLCRTALPKSVLFALGACLVACGSDAQDGGTPIPSATAPTTGNVSGAGAVTSGGSVAAPGGGGSTSASGGSPASSGSPGMAGTTAMAGNTAIAGSVGTAGTTGMAGTTAMAGTAGMGVQGDSAAGTTPGGGGSGNMGGDSPMTGGAQATGGSAMGGESAGGAPPGGEMGGGMGGEPGGASAGETSAGETSGGAGDTGACEAGMTAGNEVAIIGDSFIAATQVASEIQSLARANGSLSQGESYVNNSVSGTRLGDGAIPRQYTQAQAQNSIRIVLMDGGGNDCLQANDPNSPLSAAQSLFEEMQQDGVESVVYFFYPDPAGGNFASLKSCLDELRPNMKALCDGLASPTCYFIDLRESWNGNGANYTSDGIHPNAEGSRVTAEAVWEVMAKNCVAQ